jgi:hypothetical protein
MGLSDALGKIYPNVKKFALSQSNACNDQINAGLTHIASKRRLYYPQMAQNTRNFYPLATRTYGR